MHTFFPSGAYNIAFSYFLKATFVHKGYALGLFHQKESQRSRSRSKHHSFQTLFCMLEARHRDLAITVLPRSHIRQILYHVMSIYALTAKCSLPTCVEWCFHILTGKDEE